MTSETPTALAAGAVEAGDRVCVACNAPQGVNFLLPNRRSVVLAGSGASPAMIEGGVLPLSGGYGLTLVAKDDWDEILRRYGASPLFKNGLIFAASTPADAAAEARVREGVKHGAEPAEPEPVPEG